MCIYIYTDPPQRPPGVMSVLDDICFQMHGQSEGADGKLLEVRRNTISSAIYLHILTSEYYIF